MKTDELREAYLAFYASKGHARYPSDSLVPENDPSLLFTGAGMNQFKDMFLGRGKLPHKRIATAQKCLRVGDLDTVGRTARHHTFFEMLGNFSFGDYFKADAIPWCWEFYHKTLGIPAERLWASVYEKDDEAAEIWKTKVGMPAAKIVRMGEADNFWPANAPSKGPNGPCGPCSELYYDFGAERGCGKPGCAPGCDCDRFVEIGNIVFTQFDRQGGGALKPLAQKNIDFGGGLERVAAVMQGVHSNFQTDVFRAILAAIADALRVPYDEASDAGRRFRRIADHVRAVTFLIGDGVIPSNEERGYVVRKILRRALTDGVALGAKEEFLHKVVPAVAGAMRGGYPELVGRAPAIAATVLAEEKRYLNGLDQGTPKAEARIQELKGAGLPAEASAKAGKKAFPGGEAFQLYDTFGFPIEVLEGMLDQAGLALDREGFEKALEEQRKRSRQTTKLSADIFGGGPLIQVKAKIPLTTFLGYKDLAAEAKVLAIFAGDQVVERAAAGTDVTLLLDQTPFYGESGGQVGDTGRLAGDGVTVEVLDTQKTEGFFLHQARVASGTLAVGMRVRAEVDAARRDDLMRNHTATHMMQSALRRIVGAHVEQRGSLVAPDRLRFDFTHTAAVDAAQLRDIEEFVYAHVLGNDAVETEETTLVEAKKRGALAFFGEKYGERVRMVAIGDYSRELCGGTHVSRTGNIGFFKVLSEGSVGSGVRRIEATTGRSALARVRDIEKLVTHSSAALGVPAQTLPEKVQALVEEKKALQQELGKHRKEVAGGRAKQLAGKAKDVGGVMIVTAKVEAGSVDELRTMVDGLVKKEGLGAVALAAVVGEKPAFIVGVHPDAVKRGLHAGNLAKEIGKAAGGGGGGKDSLAQAGGADAGKIDAGLARFEGAVGEKLV